jgi:hypothetical protein
MDAATTALHRRIAAETMLAVAQLRANLAAYRVLAAEWDLDPTDPAADEAYTALRDAHQARAADWTRAEDEHRAAVAAWREADTALLSFPDPAQVAEATARAALLHPPAADR